MQQQRGRYGPSSQPQQQKPQEPEQKKPVDRNIPQWLQDYMVGDLVSSLETKQYVSASVQARNLLKVADKNPLPPSVLALAQRATQVLNEKGYTEQRYLESLQEHVANNACPPDAIPALADGTCPMAYFPMLGDGSKNKCCMKLKRTVEKMDDSNWKLYGQIQDLLDPSERKEFLNRFALQKGSDQEKEKNNMLNANMPDYTQKYISEQIEYEKIRLERDLEADEKNQDTAKSAERLGISVILYTVLLKHFGKIRNLVTWWCTKDWTYWFIGIWIFRVLLMFACIWLQFRDVGKTIDAIAQKYIYGFKPVTFFLVSQYSPIIMTCVLFNSMISFFAGQGAFNFVFSSLQASLGGYMTLGFFHGRIMHLLTSVGFTYNLNILIQDLFTFSSHVYENFNNQLGPLDTSLPDAVIGATHTYCNAKIRDFFIDSLKGVRYTVIKTLEMLCYSIATLLHAIDSSSVLATAGSGLCGFIIALLNTVLYSTKDPSVNDLLSEDPERLFDKTSFDTLLKKAQTEALNQNISGWKSFLGPFASLFGAAPSGQYSPPS